MRPREFEAAFGIELPSLFKDAVASNVRGRRDLCELLVFRTKHPFFDIGLVNDRLHRAGGKGAWPSFLIAFASNGGEDYFAFDYRSSPPSVVFIDGDRSVAESLSAEDRLTFSSFEKWREERFQSSVKDAAPH